MEPVSDLLNLAFIEASTHTKKDKRQRSFYRQNAFYENTTSEDNNDEIAKINNLDWLEADRRSGEDRRATELTRHQRFELRNKKDRRKAQSLSVKA